MTSKPNAIVYLRRNDLIVGGKHITPGKLKFTPDVIANMEVQDPDKFITLCGEFFSSHNLKGKRVLIVLDQSIVFSKAIDLDKSSKDDINYLKDSYVSAMPFEAGQRATVKLELENQLQLFATNADLYRAVSEALDLTGVRKLVSITPSPAYSIDFSGNSSEIIDQFIADKKVRNKINFSTADAI